MLRYLFFAQHFYSKFVNLHGMSKYVINVSFNKKVERIDVTFMYAYMQEYLG